MKHILIILGIVAVCVAAQAQSGDPLPYFSPLGALSTGTTPQNGTSAVETFTISDVQAATVSFSFKGKTGLLVLTGTESNANITAKAKAAIEGMATVGSSNTSVATTGTAARAIAVTFSGALAKLNVPLMATAVTSGSITVSGTLSTPGVTADGRSAAKGQLLIDKGDGTLYINQGSAPNPSWKLITITP